MKSKKLTLSAAALAALLALASQWEGKKNTAYQDIVGVWTICYGETAGVKNGDRYTDSQCRDMLKASTAEHWDKVSPCVTGKLSDGEQVAIADLAYNVGPGAVCKSTALRLMNSGDRKGGCEALLNFSYAGGKFVQGLYNRRMAERQICLTM